MKLKTYNAPTLHAALRLARIELGSEAVLLEAKEREAETAEARFQVTFALGARAASTEAPPARLEMPHWKSYLSDSQAVSGEPPSELGFSYESAGHREPEPQRQPARKTKAEPPKRPRAALEAPAPFATYGVLRTQELAAIFGRLIAVGLSAGEATALAAQAAQVAGRDDDAPLLLAGLRAAFDAGWKIHVAAEPKVQATRVIALVGPAGAGKSITAVKTATLLLRSYDRPVALVSVGRHPVGGVEPLEAWTTLLNLRLEIVESPEELPAKLERLTAAPRPPGAVIVDTPADGGADDALEASGPLERHLVVPATYSPADLLRTVERYGERTVDAVLLTRLDEAAAPGSVWGFQRATGLPVSFLGCGPSAPGALQPATAERLTQRLLGC